jgi:hypothetical protein
MAAATAVFVGAAIGAGTIAYARHRAAAAQPEPEPTPAAEQHAPTADAPPPPPPAERRVEWSPDDARGAKLAVRCAADSAVLALIACAIVAVAWREMGWGSLREVLAAVAAHFPAEAALVRRLLA